MGIEATAFAQFHLALLCFAFAVPQYAVRTAALVANADYVRPPNKYTFAGV